jgi:quinoprotein glucose dehydrogenase
MKKLSLALSLLLVFAVPNKDVEWPEYLGGPGRNHYSTLDQVNTKNVSQLQKAWEYHTGDSSGQMQCNPIIVNGLLYATTASLELFALDAATGIEKWRFKNTRERQWYSQNRGVVYWEQGVDKRILFSAGNWLYAVDAETGQPVTSFGEQGRVNLKSGLGPQSEKKFVIAATPGTVFKNLIIMPLRLSEGSDAAPGYIQAFDIPTGKLVWVFKTIPGPGETGYETWDQNNHLNVEVGGANSWAGMSIDRRRGIVYVPTGSAAFDFYGGNRKGDNLFANSLIALEAATGKRIWHYQLVHHDVWDRDLPAPPNLITVVRNGKKIDAVAQITKQGYVYVFERETGKPLFDIKEVAVPTNGVPGEYLSPTQPLPVAPAPFARQGFHENALNPWAENFAELIVKFKTYRKEVFAPPSLEGTLILPGFDGGGEWGGAAFDQESGLLYVNSNEVPNIIKLSAAKKATVATAGNAIYLQHCAVCHRDDLSGQPAAGYPSLQNIAAKKTRKEIMAVVSSGKGMMPGFPQLDDNQVAMLADYLLGTEKKEVGAVTSKSSLPYTFDGYTKFLDVNGYPAIKPPWGTLTAIDLNTGKHIWKQTLGVYKELLAKGKPPTGTENYGGAVVTKGGLLFIAATRDETFRAFDKKTGKLLWETELPASSFATPSTYEVKGKQFVVLACGGNKLGTKKGDSYVAYCLK